MSDNTINPEGSDNKEQDPDKPGETPGNTDEQSFSDQTKSDTEKATEEEKPSPAPVQQKRPAISDSDNHISLIDRNNLQLLISTKKGVRVSTVVNDKATAAGIQSDEIYLPPRNDFGKQEAEIMISVSLEDDKSAAPDIEQGTKEVPLAEGRFTPRLIDENLIKVKFELLNNESVRIEYDFRDRKTSASAKRYKNYLSAKEEGRVYEVEVTVLIEDAKEEALYTEGDQQGKITLIPNPEVAELIQPPVPYGDYAEGGFIDSGGYKNPFDSLRALIRKNTTIGIAVAVALHIAGAGYAFYNISKKQKEAQVEEPQRLIVIQDLPDPKIRLENVEDPNKPPPTEENEEVSIPPKRTVPPRRVVQPPKVNRPEDRESDKDTTEASDLAKELDSLRRLGDSLLASDSASAIDTMKAFYDIPDSLRNSFSEQDIGLGMYFPNNWKLIDEREINKNEKMFRGVLLTDTTASQPGTMTIFIHLDKENKGFNTEEFTTEFQMLDTNLTAFAKQPETQAAHTKYEFYILNNIGTEKFSVKAEVRKEFFDKYRNEIEAVVRSINIKNRDDLLDRENEDTEDNGESTEESPQEQ